MIVRHGARWPICDRVLAWREMVVWHGARRGASVATCADVERCVCACTRVHARARAVARAREGDARPHVARRRRGDQGGEERNGLARRAALAAVPRARRACRRCGSCASASASASTPRSEGWRGAPRRARRRAQRACLRGWTETGEDEGREPTHPPNGANEVRPSRAQQTRRGSRASFPDVTDEERLARRISAGRVHE